MSEITNAERFNLGFDATQYTWFCDIESDLHCMRTLPEEMWPVRNISWQSEKELAYILAVAPPGIPFNLSFYPQSEPNRLDKQSENLIRRNRTSMLCWHEIQEDIKERFFKDYEEGREQYPDCFVAIYNSKPVITTFDTNDFLEKIEEYQDKELLVSRISPRKFKLDSIADYSGYVRYLYNHYKTKDNSACWNRNEFILRMLYPRHYIAICDGEPVIIESNHDKFNKEVENKYHRGDKHVLQVYASPIELGDIDDIFEYYIGDDC